jgi:hypothetical protein
MPTFVISILLSSPTSHSPTPHFFSIFLNCPPPRLQSQETVAPPPFPFSTLSSPPLTATWIMLQHSFAFSAYGAVPALYRRLYFPFTRILYPFPLGILQPFPLGILHPLTHSLCSAAVSPRYPAAFDPLCSAAVDSLCSAAVSPRYPAAVDPLGILQPLTLCVLQPLTLCVLQPFPLGILQPLTLSVFSSRFPSVSCSR